MDPLQDLIDSLTYSALGLSKDSFGSAVNFFVYDSIKILILLFLMVFAIGVIRTYIPRDKMKKLLSEKRFGASYLFASLFGAITPFCSCSSIPIFVGFMKTGVPLGAAFAFLVTSPIINEYLAVMMLSFFGWKITAAYVIFGIVLGVASGILIDRMNMEKHLVDDIRMMRSVDACISDAGPVKSLGDRLRYGYDEAYSITVKLWKWILFGVAIGAVIHGFVPEKLVNDVLSATGIFSVPLAVALGVPIYANCSSILPIAVALFEKGVPLGTALAFMMATAALSLPEAIILRRVMKLPLILTFFGIVSGGIVVIGYLFNYLVVIL
ncbi:MAG: permease [Candidatus Altiarchaeia archaeon]|jgi:hypothetical protein